MAVKKKIRKTFEEGRVYVVSGYNNTIITLTDPAGATLAWSSAGANGFKGARQATPYAGQISAEKVAEKALAFGMKTVDVYIKGMGAARDQSIRGLMNVGLGVKSIMDVSRVPHGGCRPKRQRKM